MNTRQSQISRIALSLLICSFFALTGVILSDLAEAKIIVGSPAFDRANPAVQAVIAVQERHTRALMTIPDVVGTATGLTDEGRPSLLVFIKNPVASGVIPRAVEGVPVNIIVTGEIFAMKPPANKPGKQKSTVDPTARFDRPVPIGVSTGNIGECSAGTIGARLTDGSSVYALSNNHVFASENTAPVGSTVLQPGRYDTLCSVDADNAFGTLYAFVPIKFDGSANAVDAAIALTSTEFLGDTTPANGYGTPKASPVQEKINDSVQKYGRTSSLTKGTIVGINATINVSYDSGVAQFAGQIVISSSKPFIKPGDSGSLLVTSSRNPVGLLFAGNINGKYAFANPIGTVLDALGQGAVLTIDGE